MIENEWNTDLEDIILALNEAGYQPHEAAGEDGAREAVESDDWQKVSDLPRLVQAVNALWAARDALLNKYIGMREE